MWPLLCRSRRRRPLLWQDGKLLDTQSGTGTQAQGKRAAAWIDLGESGEYLVKVGLSYVSQAGALANLKSELPGWNFETTKRNAEATWSKALGAVEIETTNTTDKTIFYTALYHNLLEPSVLQRCRRQLHRL